MCWAGVFLQGYGVSLINFSRVPNWVTDTGLLSKISPSSAKVLIALARKLNAKSDSGSVSIEGLCEMTGLSKTTVYKSLSELEITKVVDRGYGKSSYTFRQGGIQIPDSGKLDSGRAEYDSGRAETLSGRAETLHYTTRTSFKNILQEDDHACIPFDGVMKNAYQFAGEILTGVKWNPHRRGGDTGERLLATALLRIRDGARGDTASTDPGGWIGGRMAEYLESLSGPGFHPKFPTWIRENYPDLVSEGEPLEIHR